MSSSRNELFRNMMASSVCVAGSVVLFNPLDCLRVRWQVSTAGDSALGLRGYAAKILRNEGLWRGLWWPGVGSNAVAAGVCRGIGMGCYPTTRDWLLGIMGADNKNAAAMFAAGMLSGGVGYGISTPGWVLKTRLQASASQRPPVYKNGIVGLWEIGRQEGMRGLYRGASALVMRGSMMNAGNAFGYDMAKTMARQRNWEDGPALHVAASVVAAFLSCTLSCPADLIMTKYQVAKVHTNSQGLGNFIARLIKTEGPSILYKGWTALFVRVAPVYILYLPVYEQVRVRVFGLDYMS